MKSRRIALFVSARLGPNPGPRRLIIIRRVELLCRDRASSRLSQQHT